MSVRVPKFSQESVKAVHAEIGENVWRVKEEGLEKVWTLALKFAYFTALLSEVEASGISDQQNKHPSYHREKKTNKLSLTNCTEARAQ